MKRDPDQATVSEPYAESDRTHWDGCWRFHEGCDPRCQVCGELVTDRFDLWEEPRDGSVIRGHKGCIRG